ncbi:MAG: type II toxin-antitoxin system VapC family toxin [Acidimicrobiia bacterium]
MTLIVDAGPVVASADETDSRRALVQDLLRNERGALILPAPVSMQVDSLLGESVSRSTRRAYREDLADGRFEVVCLEPEDYGIALQLDQQYPDLDLGLGQLSIIVLARKLRTRRVLTFEHKCFRAVKPLQGGAFTLLPTDTSDQTTLPLS